ncbi:MAG TPA: 23S rRNA (guanosine(2251)-2'-O)-methyltransferase RlmB [Kofleriaceae bacterium]|nr:23S rRNA (guanosine(2251)-2'-O)-methyltransferase RlmB [Kofleriaceae bacterium]
MSRLVYGTGPVTELVRSRAKSITVLYVSDRQRRADAAMEAKQRGVTIEVRADAELDALAGRGARHQGLVAIAGEYVYAELHDILARAAGGSEPALVVALDGVQDPHNLGAIARSAYVLGAHGLVVPRDRAAPVTSVVTKASAGATEHLLIAQVTNLTRALGELKDAGLWIAAVAASSEAVPLRELDATGPLCLVLGAEGSGVRPVVARACDYAIMIPMAGTGVGSLNVSVAAGVALYEVSRQRAK